MANQDEDHGMRRRTGKGDNTLEREEEDEEGKQ